MHSSMDQAQLDAKGKFVIKYQEHEPKVFQKKPRYSSKSQFEQLKRFQKSQQVRTEKKLIIKNLPSYQQPTENFLTAKVQKNRSTSIAELKQQPSNPIIQNPRNKSFEREKEFESDKQYSRVPIEYYDERDNGCGAEGLKGRIIYKGYAPKNTYFFLKTVKPLNVYKKLIPNSLRNDFELKFNSKFESGNLSAVNRISQNQFWLFMREDTNTHGLRQWFYFQAINRKAMKVKFRIYKFSKYYSLYRLGMKPFIRNWKQSSAWKQGGDKIIYEYDSYQKGFYLEFQYKFEEDNQAVQFATLPPYTYSMLNDYLEELKQNPLICIDKIGESLAGLQIPFISIIDKSTAAQKKRKTKQAIFIMARTHPGETVSNFALESMIQKILSLKQLLAYYNFFIVPMVNPDGVFFGNHRTGVLGQDINRNFHNSDVECFPEVQAVQAAIAKVKQIYKIRFLIDLHGHSAKKNIFAYGDENEIQSKNFLLTRILPKLLNDSISSFKYDYCVFRGSKQKKNTARVFFSQKFKLNAITFEQSYGLLDNGCIGIVNWRNFGASLAQCLLQFARIYENGEQKALELYLKEQIVKEKEVLSKRIERHKKMLGIESLPELKQKQKTEPKKIGNLKQKFLTKQAQKEIEEEKEEIEKIQKKLNTQIIVNDHQKSRIQTQKQKQRETQKSYSSVNSQQLSSGDQDLELFDDELQVIKKEIVRVGCQKQGMRREIYNVADKKLQLNSWQFYDEHRLHQQKSSMIPRILKLQMQRKEQYRQNIRRDMYDKSYLRRDRLAFPQIRK